MTEIKATPEELLTAHILNIWSALYREKEKITRPERLSYLIYALTKHAFRDDFLEFLESWSITEKEYFEISEYWKENGINPYI